MKNLSKAKLIILSSALSLLLCFCPGFVRAFSIAQDFWISYTAYFFAVLILCHRYPSHKGTIVLSFVFTVVILYGILTLYTGVPFTLPNILSTIVASIFAYLFSISARLLYQVLIVGTSVILCVYFVFWGLGYYNNYYNYGNFTGRTDQKVEPSWQSYIEVNSGFSPDSLNGKLLLLDFYNTWCSVCFQKFPKLEALYNKQKNNPAVAIYAVDIPWREDTIGRALLMVRSRNYTFPVLIGKKGLDSIFHLVAYPTVILLQNNHVLFKGDIEQVERFLEKH